MVAFMEIQDAESSVQSRYENKKILNEYLLFHYGNDRDQMPFSFEPSHSIHFPIRCVNECVKVKNLHGNAKALDLGCAVGRSSFELARFCKKVIAIDNSKQFIEAALLIQRTGKIDYEIIEEGARIARRTAFLPEGIDPKRVNFICKDAIEFAQMSDPFDIVLAANLICRLFDPVFFLSLLPNLVVKGGQLILTSPYSWLEEFTPPRNWLARRKSSLECIKEIIGDHFYLEETLNLPFIMREHLRKYQWCVSEASIWKRK